MTLGGCGRTSGGSGVERQMAVPLHGCNQTREDHFEAFSADTIRSLPTNDESLLDRLRIDSPAERGCAGDGGIKSRDEVNRVFAMAVSDVDELIKDLGFLNL
jgi:hypothetical protein